MRIFRPTGFVLVREECVCDYQYVLDKCLFLPFSVKSLKLLYLNYSTS